jgi:hypothetical protein
MNDYQAQWSINSSNIRQDYYTENAAWDLTSVEISAVEIKDRFYARYNELYPMRGLSVELYLSRKPLYFMMNGVFPCLVLNVVTLIMFGCPPIPQFTISVTLFMTFSVNSVRVSGGIYQFV